MLAELGRRSLSIYITRTLFFELFSFLTWIALDLTICRSALLEKIPVLDEGTTYSSRKAYTSDEVQNTNQPNTANTNEKNKIISKTIESRGNQILSTYGDGSSTCTNKRSDSKTMINSEGEIRHSLQQINPPSSMLLDLVDSGEINDSIQGKCLKIKTLIAINTMCVSLLFLVLFGVLHPTPST